MKKLSLIISLIALLFTVGYGQETVVWAAEVIDVSSEYSPYEYSAVQALYRPNVLPNGGDNPNAWRPKNQSKEEFIVVAFDTPIRAKQVAIAESENPGAIKAVYGYDKDYNEYLLFELAPRNLPIETRLLNLFFEETPYEVQAVRVVLDGVVSEGYNSIDAIGISSSNIPINVLINLAGGTNPNVQAERLSANVNSNYVEHSPIVSPDGKRLYFSRQFHPENMGGVDDSEDIWVSELDEETGEWLPAKNVGPPLNNKGPNFISSINYLNGEEVLILGNRYGKNGRMYTGVSMSKYKDGEFEEPVAIEIENEYNYSPNADFFLASGGQAMLMSAERDDTYGKRDLYVSFLKRDGKTWTEPMNLGSDINTIGEDESPFLAEDGKTLYFSSDGYTGYGGADIYVTFKLDETWKKWSDPENLGAGVNKDGNDEYFSIPSSGDRLYFTRGEKGEDTDVFSFKVDELFIDDEAPIIASVEHLIEKEPEVITITVFGKVLDAKTKEPLANAPVSVERLPDGVEAAATTSDENGDYTFTVRNGAKYGARADREHYIAENENFDFNDVEASMEVERDLLLVPIEVGETIVIKNIFFDFDKSDLKTASYIELNRVLGYLSDNTINKITISGHTDNVGNDDYNLGLSRRRAKAVMDFFIKNGIDRTRLVFEAYGESKPIVPNDTPENREKNRRVEFMINE